MGGGSMTEVVGCFHFERTVSDRVEALSAWRVTTGHADVAATVAGLFGGAPLVKSVAEGVLLEVLTDVAAVPIAFDRVGETRVLFRLLAGYDLGLFLFCSTPWRLAEIPGGGLLGGMDEQASGELAIEPVEFRTRGGQHVMHLLPAVRVTDSGA